MRASKGRRGRGVVRKACAKASQHLPTAKRRRPALLEKEGTFRKAAWKDGIFFQDAGRQEVESVGMGKERIKMKSPRSSLRVMGLWTNLSCRTWGAGGAGISVGILEVRTRNRVTLSTNRVARLTCQCPAALCIHLGIRRQEDISNQRVDWTEEPLGTE